MSSKLPPAENAFPAPLNSATRTSGSRSTVSHTSASSRCTSGPTALRFGPSRTICSTPGAGRANVSPGNAAYASLMRGAYVPTRRCGTEARVRVPQCRISLRSSGGGALQDVHAAGRAEPDHVGEPDLGAVDLAVAGLAAEVVADLPDVRDARRRDRVTLRLEAARHVHGRLAVAPRRARLEEVDRAALGAQHEVVVVHELRGREAVVQLDEVEVLRRHAGLRVRLRRRVAR